jgi:hypothetical protein
MKAKLEAIKDEHTQVNAYDHLVQLLKQVVLSNDRDAYDNFEYYSHALKNPSQQPAAPAQPQTKVLESNKKLKALLNKPNVGTE